MHRSTLRALGFSALFHGALGAAVMWGLPRAKLPPVTVEPRELPGSTGESFDVPIEPDLRLSEGDQGTPVVGAAAMERGQRAAAAPRRGGVRSAAASAGPVAPEEVFGAAGERGAVDLATAFTRAFPQAASADPAWLAAQLGAAGEAEVVLDLDAEGHLEDARVSGSPSSALRAGINRTLALIRARDFTSTGPRTTLHVTAAVSPDVVHDGLHGDVFAIGGSYLGGEGQAFFALAAGRRIDLRVRARAIR